MNNEIESTFKYFVYAVVLAMYKAKKERVNDTGFPIPIAPTKRKVMLFLFFACVLRKDLLKIFFKWYALPKGPMEDDAFGVWKKFPTLFDDAVKYAETKYNENILTR